MQDLIYQINFLKVLKKYGTSISYFWPEKGYYRLSIIIFADASKQDDHGQLSYLAGHLFGNLESGSIFTQSLGVFINRGVMSSLSFQLKL